MDKETRKEWKKIAKENAKRAKKEAKLGSSADPDPGKPLIRLIVTPQEQKELALAMRSVKAAEKNARIRVLQLIVAVVGAGIVLIGILWQMGLLIG